MVAFWNGEQHIIIKRSIFSKAEYERMFRMINKIKHAIVAGLMLATATTTTCAQSIAIEPINSSNVETQKCYDWIEGEPHRFECTGYYPGGICANGEPAVPGVVAVDPNIIPLGTWIYVEVDGRPDLGVMCLKACDTGSAIQGHIIDICTDDPYGIGRRGCTVWY